MSTTIMWFRKDLRLDDNTAFNKALDSLKPTDSLLCLFHLNDQQFKIGSKSHDYFFATLENFRATAVKKGIFIHLISDELTDSYDEVLKLYPDTNQVFFNLDNRGYGRQRDLSMIAYLEAKGLKVTASEDAHLHPATAVVKEDGTFYKKFTPYYRKWQLLSVKPYSHSTFDNSTFKLIHDTINFEKGESVFNKLLTQRVTDFSHLVGDKIANKKLNDFLFNHLDHYDIDRDYPAKKGTSQLSPYLTTGTLSIRKVWQAANQMPSSNGKETFLKELAWRDFYHMIYFNNPNQYDEELIEKYRDLNWQTNEDLLKKWQTGQTGYPIIDAAMRQLNQTGWMHNRLRMLVACFLTKDLLIDWRLGEKYFSEQLIDYDSASNIGGWQWAASTGTDAVPYFRIFNPTTQGIKFDKEATFIKHFVPELATLPAKYCHEPNLMTRAEQEQYDVRLDVDYPTPIVDHGLARKKALEWFDQPQKID